MKKIMFKIFNKKNKIETVKKSMIKDIFKNGVVIIGVSMLIYLVFKNNISPEPLPDQIYIDLKNTIKEPNLNESEILLFQKNANKFVFARSVVVGSNFTPFYKWLTIPQIEILRKFTLFYFIQYIENDQQNQFFNFNLDKISINNIHRFKSGYYENGIILNFPINNRQEYENNKYLYSNRIGNFEEFAKIDNTDEVNVINLLNSSSNGDIYLICQNLQKINNKYLFSSCKTEYSAGLDYFKKIWLNINNVPDFVFLKTKLFYEYYALSIQGLNKDSYCYKDYPIIEYQEFFINCQIDIKNGINKINNYGSKDREDYLKFSQQISKSLKIKSTDLSPSLGFQPIGYKYKAIQMLLDKYAPIYSSEQLWMIKKIVNKKWNPEYPSIVLDLSNYSEQDIYDIKNANQIGKELKQKNKELEQKQKKLP